MTVEAKVSETDIKETIATLLSQIAPEFDLDDLEADENIREALDIDSYDFLNFLIGLNEQLGVDIPEADYGKLNSLNDMIMYISEQ